MTQLREKAVQLIKEIPEDKIVYIIDILQGIKGLYTDQLEEKSKLTEKQKARERLQKFRGRIPDDFDYKRELVESRDKKYENFD